MNATEPLGFLPPPDHCSTMARLAGRPDVAARLVGVQEIEWAFRLMLEKGSDLTSALKLKQCLDAHSPVMPRRLRWAWNNNFKGPAGDSLTAGERSRAGGLLSEISQNPRQFSRAARTRKTHE